MSADQKQQLPGKQNMAKDPVPGGQADTVSAGRDPENSLLDALLQPIYIADVDTHEMLYMNKACKKLLGCGDFRGRKCYEVAQGYGSPCPFCTNDRLAEGTPYCWEHYSKMLDGTFQLQDNLIDYFGHRARIELVFDVSSHVSRETKLETVLCAQRELVRAIQTVSGTGTIDSRLNAGLRLCGEYFEADRAYIFRINESGELDNLYEWCRDGVKPQIALLQHVDIHYMDRWLPYFECQQAVVTPDIEQIRDSRPDEYRIMKMQGIQSFLEAPLFSGGRMIGFLGVDNPEASRLQNTADALLTFAYSVGSAIVQAQSEQRIRQQYEELETIVDNIPVGVSMIHVKDGRFVKKLENSLLRSLYDITEEESGEFDVIAMSRLSDPDRIMMREKMQSLLTPGTRISQTFRYSRSQAEPPRWYHILARSVAVGGETLLFSCLLDKTDEMEAEARSARSQKIYEVAAELANLTIWTYDVKKHRIILSDNSATARDIETYRFPRVIENVPESLFEYVEPECEKQMREMYSALDAGVPDYECEYRYRVKPGIPDRWERVRYTMDYDENGQPETAYAIGLDVTAERRERDRYRQSIRTLMDSNPDEIGSYRLNLTRNLFLGGDSRKEAISRALPSETADEFLRNAAEYIIGDEAQAAYRLGFSRRALLAAAERGEMNLAIEYQSRHGEDDQPWVKSSFSLIRNPETGDVECVVYAVDITRQKLDAAVMERLTEQEYDFIALLHMNTNQIDFLRVNDALAPFYRGTAVQAGKRYDYETIRTFASTTWIDQADRQYYLDSSSVQEIRRRLESGGRLEVNLRGHLAGNPEGTMCRKIRYYDLSGKKDLVLILQTDITEAYQRQLRETQLARTEAQKAEDIIDSVTAGICVFRMPDADHLEGEFVNLQMFRILGLTPPDGPDARERMMDHPVIAAYMKDAFTAVFPDDRRKVRRLFHEGYERKSFSAGSYRILKTDNTAVWVNQDCVLREIRPDCRVFYASYRVVDREVELKAELEQQLQREKLLRIQADAANAAKSEFLSRMSHDIRTPLNGIIGMTYLTKEMELPQKARENLDKIDTSSKFLLSLINDVLDMSKAESGRIELHPEPYDSSVFFGYLDSVVAPLCREKGIRFVIDAKPVPEAVPLLDTLRINQVFFNLLSNAVKFTPEGGTVTFRIREHLAQNGRLVMEGEVSDTGIGMSAEFQKHLFEPFSQEMRRDSSETRGTGLGLAIVKKMMDLMGCEITVHSQMGKGTAFCIRGEFDCIPAASVEKPKDGQETQTGTLTLAGMHILLCEDHPLNREIVKTLLAEEHVLVTIAEDGQQGLDEFAGSASGFYDAVLMDVRMPVMNGLEAARRIRHLNRPDAGTVPIIAMTADAFDDDVQKCLDAGMNGHIAKPIDPAAMLRVLLDTVRQAQPPDQG